MIGKVVFGYVVVIVDVDGMLLLFGVEGCIVVCCFDLVMFFEYWCNFDVMCDKFVGDYLFIGDMGMIDVDGFVCFVGCDDDVIMSVGYWIGFGLIEDCLFMYLVVWMVVVVGVFDVMCIEIVKVFVVLNFGYVGDVVFVSIL